MHYSNLSQEEWRAVRSLLDDRSIVSKKADKGSCVCVVVWDRWDYIKGAEKQFGDSIVYEEINYSKRILSQLVDSSNKYFKKLNSSGYISYKEMKHFTYEYKKACNLGKLYLLPKIHKRLFNVPGRPVISNCGTPTEKVSEFLDHHLKPIMQKELSYIRDSQHFLEKIKTIGSVPENSILVTADVVGLYPNILHQAGLKALKEALEKRDINPIQDGLFRGCSPMWRGETKNPSLPKLCHTFPTMMKLGTVISYLRKIQKLYESRDTPYEFC